MTKPKPVKHVMRGGIRYTFPGTYEMTEEDLADLDKLSEYLNKRAEEEPIPPEILERQAAMHRRIEDRMKRLRGD